MLSGPGVEGATAGDGELLRTEEQRLGSSGASLGLESKDRVEGALDLVQAQLRPERDPGASSFYLFPRGSSAPGFLPPGQTSRPSPAASSGQSI